MPEDVALVSIEPDQRAGSVRVVAEARSLPAALAYAQRLGSAPGIRDVHLTRHETSDRDPHRSVRMQLELRLKDQPRATP